MAKQIFVNLPVKDLEKSKEFFSKLGFTFNPQFTDENAAALVIDDGHIYAMLITHEFFKRFTKREIADATKTTEVINALSVESKEKVIEMTDVVVKNGGKTHRIPDDAGFMYSQSVEDLDGHIWEFLYMDVTKAPASPGK